MYGQRVGKGRLRLPAVVRKIGSGRILTLTFLALQAPAAAESGAAVAVKVAKQRVVVEASPQSRLPIDQPETFAIDSAGNVIFVARLRIVKLSAAGELLWTITKPPQGRFRVLADVAVDAQNRVWASEVVTQTLYVLSPQGEHLRSVSLPYFARKLVINRFGEIVTNPGRSNLVDVYSEAGELLRSFGEKASYGNDTTDMVLNTGHLATGPRGELYVSLYHPPALRAYSRQGTLLWEAPIPVDWPQTAEPEITIAKTDEEEIAVSFNYQHSSLGLGLATGGEILCLASGAPHGTALAEGSRQLAIFSPQGDYLSTISLPITAHQMKAHEQGLYLLETHPQLRLTWLSVSLAMEEGDH